MCQYISRKNGALRCCQYYSLGNSKLVIINISYEVRMSHQLYIGKWKLRIQKQIHNPVMINSEVEADNVTAKSCIPMHPSILKWATAANMILILTITKQHYTWSLSTGPLTKESRMFLIQKPRGIRVIRNKCKFNWVNSCLSFCVTRALIKCNTRRS